jgi:hypothetical protein
VGYLLKDKKLRRTDLRPFKYEMSRIFKNSTMQDYIKWLVEIGVSLENLDYLKKSIEKHWD